MSRSIEYAGADLSEWTVAECSTPAGHGMDVEAAAVPGLPGAAFVSSRIAPRKIGVRLYLDLPDLHPAEDLGSYRREIATALFSEGPAELALPGDPGLVYRDAVCADASEWTRLFSDGSCDLLFVALDPIAWGEEDGFGPIACPGGELGLSLDTVPGTAPTRPLFELVAAAGTAVEAGLGAGGPFVRVERAFAGGEEVTIDCDAGRVFVDGKAADADVALGSDYFALEPAGASLGFSGCASVEATYRARWY